MTIETKNILIRTLNHFETFSDTQKENGIKSIKEQIEAHHRAINSIGVGFAGHQVRAGEIFLRINKK